MFSNYKCSINDNVVIKAVSNIADATSPSTVLTMASATAQTLQLYRGIPQRRCSSKLAPGAKGRDRCSITRDFR